ncbi:hypothetical protein GWI33_007477 [Rhynchophorus ferrugineus]|uniref:Uncharacterized protein n=1 Tax=Rhynchophorus ferrugineus TaxID=354439 RepID=A0A834MC46_RHYFE|nr:hypothetical protein GWI33_007477 [Rhynchophorus ferrugineus]
MSGYTAFINICLFKNNGQGGTSNAESPKGDDISNTDTDTKDSQKLPFCEIQRETSQGESALVLQPGGGPQVYDGTVRLEEERQEDRQPGERMRSEGSRPRPSSFSGDTHLNGSCQ